MSAAPSLGKDLVGLEELSADQVRLILDTAEPFKEVSERPIKKVPALRGKTIVNLFFEASTRTRISFEFAEKRLSADTMSFPLRLQPRVEMAARPRQRRLTNPGRTVTCNA